MSERQPASIPQEIQSPAVSEYGQMTAAVLQTVDGGVPSIDAYHAAQYLVEDMTIDANGRAHGPDGRLLNRQETYTIQSIAKPENWVFDPETEAKARQVVAAHTVADIPEGTFSSEDIKAATPSFRTSPLEARLKFEKLKADAEAGLALSTAIKNEWMQQELLPIGHATEKEYMASALTNIEAEVVGRMAKLQAQGEGARGMAESNMRTEITKRYEAQAKQAAADAMQARQEHIDSNGGITNLAEINAADERQQAIAAATGISDKQPEPDKTDDIQLDLDTAPVGRVSDISSETFSSMLQKQEDWVKLLAKRSTISTVSRGASKEKVDVAGKEYREILETMFGEMRTAMGDKGYDEEQIGAKVDAYKKELASITVDKLAEERVNLAEERRPLTRSFLDWWARQGGGTFFSRQRIVGNFKKSLVLAPIGIGVGVAAALAAPVVGVAAAAAGLAVIGKGATGIAKGLASTQITKAANAELLADQQHDAMLTGLDEHQGDATAYVGATVESYVKRNRTRLVKAAAVAGSIALVSGTVAGVIAGGVADHAVPHTGPTGATGSTDIPHGSTQPGANMGDFDVPRGGSASGGNSLTPQAETPVGTAVNQPSVPSSPEVNFAATDRYPWNYYARTHGEGQATAVINHLMDRARAAGWTVHDSLAGPEAQIDFIQSPDGTRFWSTEDIIRSLELFEEES